MSAAFYIFIPDDIKGITGEYWLSTYKTGDSSINKIMPVGIRWGGLDNNGRNFLEWNPAPGSPLIASGNSISGLTIYNIKDKTAMKLSDTSPVALRWTDDGRYLEYIIKGKGCIYDLQTKTSKVLYEDQNLFDIIWVWDTENSKPGKQKAVKPMIMPSQENKMNHH